MEFWNESNKHVALSADNPSIDLLLPSTQYVCYLCKIELVRYTRMIVRVNPQEKATYNQERYRNYCVRCIALNSFEISGPSQMLTYYVCPPLNKSDAKLEKWSVNQASRLFECIHKRRVTKGSQLYRDFIKNLKTRKEQKQMEAFYETMYSKYFKGNDLDHRLKKREKEAEERQDKKQKKSREIQEIQIKVKGNKKYFQQFTDLLHEKQDVVLPENIEHDYFLKLLASKQVQQTFNGSNFTKKPNPRQSQLLSIIVKKYAESQIRKQQLRANVSQLYESYSHARQGLHIRQNVEVNVSKQVLFNCNHPQMKELTKLQNFQATFNKLADHRQETINMSKLFKIDGSAKKTRSNPHTAKDSIEDKPVTPKKKQEKRPKRVKSSEKEVEDYSPNAEKRKVDKQKRMKRQLRKLQGESSSKKSSGGSRKDSSRERKSAKKN